jgi:hypothetical protein
MAGNSNRMGDTHDGATPARSGVRAAIARAKRVATQKTSGWSHDSDASSDFHDMAWVVLFVVELVRVPWRGHRGD